MKYKLLILASLMAYSGTMRSNFILFGTKTYTTTKEIGAILCPICLDVTEYSLKEIERYFTLYFIPLFSLGLAGKECVCKRCGTRFDPSLARTKYIKE